MTAPAAVVVASNVGRKAAATAGGLISEALTADLAVIRYQYQPHARRKKKGNPVDMELHINPAAL